MTRAALFEPWAVLVAKDFGRAKSRLTPALSVDARRALARSMFTSVLDACKRTAELRGTLVATDGDEAAAIALRRGAQVLRDAPGQPRLSATVDAALAQVRGLGASHALVVMADLPLLRARDLRELLALLDGADVVIAADAERRGTGALGLRLDVSLPTCFGHRDSLLRHLAAAQRAGASVRMLYSPRLALDLDAPGHLQRFQTATRRRGARALSRALTPTRAGGAAPRPRGALAR